MTVQPTLIRTLEDGTIIEGLPGYARHTRPDGVVSEHFYGGHQQITHPDGTRINKWADGSEWTYLPDGSRTVKYPDGRTQTFPAPAAN